MHACFHSSGSGHPAGQPISTPSLLDMWATSGSARRPRGFRRTTKPAGLLAAGSGSHGPQSSRAPALHTMDTRKVVIGARKRPVEPMAAVEAEELNNYR